MATTKLSITLPDDLARMVKYLAKEEGTSVSAVIADVLGAVQRQRAADEATRWFEEEEGPLTVEELIEAEKIWQAAEAHQQRMRRAD
jgi:predicted transcriptional regulator